MPDPVTPQTTNPILKEIRRQLEAIFAEVYLVHSVIVISVETISSQNSDFDPEVARVLTRCGADKLHGQLTALTNIIEAFGGRTDFSERQDTVVSANATGDVQ